MQQIMNVKRQAALLVAAMLLSMSFAGCASTLRPRTSAELQYKDYKSLGAVHDASRAYPIAFYADPTQDPQVVQVPFGLPAGKVLAAQWITHLAAKMNQALHEVGLYDRRFASFAHRVFHNNLSSGDYIYDFKGDAQVDKDIKLSGARIVKLRLKSMTVATAGSEQTVRLVVEATVGGLPRLYQANSNGANWDQQCFDRVARKILGDPGFWKVVAQAP